MRPLLVIFVLTAGYGCGVAHAERARHELTVAEPYIELHTGPGRGFPVHDVVGRGGNIEILKRRTDWYKVRTQRGGEGWVSGAAIAQTLRPSGEVFEPERADFADLDGRRWEMGVLSGDFAGANVISVYGAFAFTRHLSAELSVGQALGGYSNSSMAQLSVVHTFFPEWRITPFFTLGTGVIRTEPNATLVRTEDRSDGLVLAGIGVRSYLTRRFMLRAEYKSYVVLTSRDDNEETNEWKAGFSFFF